MEPAERGLSAHRPRIVVCGGGLAGVAAACEAAGAGAEVTLVERRPFLGGKAYSFATSTGRELDNGQHVFLGCCPAYLALLRLLGTSDRVVLQRSMRVPVRDRSGVRGALWAAPLPAPAHLGPAFTAYPHLTTREKAAAGQALAALRLLGERGRRRIDDITFLEWLEAHGQGRRAVEALWDLIVLPTCNDRSERVSAGLAAFVFKEGLLRRRAASAVGYARVGLTSLVDPATRTFLAARGGRVMDGSAVAEAGPGGVWLTDGRHLPADGVVLALPPERTREVASAALPADPGLGSSPIVNVHAWFDRPVMDDDFEAIIDSPAQWVFNRTAITGGGPGQHLAVSISGAREEVEVPREELAERIVAELAHLYPRAAGARLEEVAVVKEPHATFAAAPGQAARRPGPHTPLERVALAGAWTATGWPATMEGAVRSGMRAARVALEHDVQPSLSRFP